MSALSLSAPIRAPGCALGGRAADAAPVSQPADLHDSTRSALPGPLSSSLAVHRSTLITQVSLSLSWLGGNDSGAHAPAAGAEAAGRRVEARPKSLHHKPAAGA